MNRKRRTQKFETITIIGLGLMGGSLAAACRKNFPHSRIIGISRNSQALSAAKRRKWIHKGTNNLRDGIRDADIIILCTPVDVMADLLTKCERFARAGTVVTDVGSVKGELLALVERKKWKRIRFVGAHPMVGSHERGVGACQPGLYNQGFAFLVQGSKSDRKAYVAVKRFWQKITPKIITVSADEHDRIVAEISHLPHVAAVALMQAVHKKYLPYSASGFRDSSRIAMGHPAIWLPVLMANRKRLSQSLQRFERQLRLIRTAMTRHNSRQLQTILSGACHKRQQI